MQKLKTLLKDEASVMKKLELANSQLES